MAWLATRGFAGLALGAACLALSACSSGDDSSPASSPTAAANSGSPTATPIVVGFEAAFPRLPKLDRPTAMVEVPGRRMLVTLQDGRIVSFANDPAAADLTTALDQRAKTSRDDNEEGLLGLALDPDFGRNGFLYVYYSVKPGERRTVLARLKTSGSGTSLAVDAASELILLTVPEPFGNHKGGEVVFGPDGMLYLGLGDGGSGGDPQGNGQDLKKNLLASIIRIDVRGATAERPYAIPPDNPFATLSDGSKRETWAYGLRNPWRFSFDRQTGQLWAGDVGQGAREEIDIIEKGKNYGWNVMEGFSCFKPQKDCPRDGLELPVLDYDHSDGNCSVTGGYVYRGSAAPSVKGAYIYGDFCTGAVWAIPSTATAGQRPEPRTILKKGPQISSFAEDVAGEIYLLGFDGKIYRLAQGQ